MISLFSLHCGVALWLFFGVKTVEALPWESQQLKGWALIEVRDSLLPTKKGAGVVYCVGWKDEFGRIYDESFVLRCVIARSDSAEVITVPQALRKYWVPTNLIQSYSEPEVPFDPNWRRIMRTLGIHGYMSWKSDEIILEKEPMNDLFTTVYRCKNQLLIWIRKVLYSQLNETNAGLTYAMLIGDKSGLDIVIEKQFGVGGLLHVLAVSGMHVSLIMGALLWILTGFGYRGRPSIKTLFLLMAAGWFYAFLSGSSASVIRAMIGASWVWLGKFAVHRRQKLTHVLCGSAYLQWVSDPFIVEQLGFQLSYLAVLGIATLHSRWIALYEQSSSALNAVISSLSLTLSATLFTLPLILFQFGSFPTWFLLGNLFLLPLFSLMVYLSLICLLLVWVPYVSEGLFVFLDFLIHSVLQLLGLFEQLPLPQLNTLMLGMGSLFCLMLVVFFIDRYFMVLMKIDHRSNSQLNRQISFSLMGVFFGLMAFYVVHELEIQSNYNRAETFTMSYYKSTFTVVKIDQKLIIDGEIRNAKTQEKILEKLKNYTQQMGIETIEWRYRGRDSP
jgi:ComEC/Rec2-related protein